MKIVGRFSREKKSETNKEFKFGNLPGIKIIVFLCVHK